MFVGMLLMALAFIVASIVQRSIDVEHLFFASRVHNQSMNILGKSRGYSSTVLYQCIQWLQLRYHHK